MNKYVAFFAANCESETFETFEEAKNGLQRDMKMTMVILRKL